MPSLSLRMLGTLVFLCTATVVVAAMVGLAYALGKGDRRLAKRIATGAAVVVAAYVAILAAGPLLTPARAVPPGQELSFCGFDCHLHVSAVSSRREDGLDVTLRFRSDAKRAPEFPGTLRVRVADAAGRRYAPLEPLPVNPLSAGETATRTLHFAVPADAAAPRVLVTWDGWVEFLVPGPGNPLVQRKAALLLAGP